MERTALAAESLYSTAGHIVASVGEELVPCNIVSKSNHLKNWNKGVIYLILLVELSRMEIVMMM